jgi:hypothetical protein
MEHLIPFDAILFPSDGTLFRFSKEKGPKLARTSTYYRTTHDQVRLRLGRFNL